VDRNSESCDVCRHVMELFDVSRFECVHPGSKLLDNDLDVTEFVREMQPPVWCPLLKERNGVSEATQRELTPEELATNIETMKHIRVVRFFLDRVIQELEARARCHDSSKMALPEVEVFTKYTPILRGLTYGSPEYKQCLEEMNEGALKHHYANNRHHPEHFVNGVEGMNLIDLIEMLCDWKAATMRHADGDIQKSLDINEKRFNMPPGISKLLRNTVECFGWERKENNQSE
jgi:hypothetical protein